MGGSCAIRLLGGFAVEVHGCPVPAHAWRHSRGAELMKVLALTPRHRVHREQVMDTLWPDLPPDAAGANLRKAIHFLRRALGAPQAVVLHGSIVALCPEWTVETDIAHFEAAAQQALGQGPEACAAAASLYTGELLPDDRYTTWTIEPRDRLRLRYIQLLKQAQMWDAVLDVDPTDEDANQALMAAYVDAGNRPAAMRQFERLRDALRADLGVAPDARSVALYEKAIAMGGPPSPTMRERASGQLAWGLVYWNRMELEEAAACAQEARTLAVAAELGRELGEASFLLGLVAHARGEWQELFRSEFVDSLDHRPALAPFVFDAHLCLAEVSQHAPDSHQEIEPFAQSLLDIATRAGSVRGQALAVLMLGEHQLFSGRLSEADATLSRAVELHKAADASSGLVIALIRLAQTNALRDRRWHATRLLRRALRLAEIDPLAPHLVVGVYEARVLAATDAVQAAAIIEEAERALSSGDVCQPCSIGYHVAAAVTRARSGDVSSGRRHLEKAERIAGMWQGGPWQAAVWEARGDLRIAEGERALGSALLQEAADLFGRSGRPLDADRCRKAASS